MKLFNKTLLINEDSIYFDENYIVNNIKSNLIRENKLSTPIAVRFNAYELGYDIINRLINDNHLYNYIKAYFTSDSCPMNISIIKDGKVFNYYLYKKNLLETIDELIKKDKINITSEVLNNIKELTDSISINKLKDKLYNKNFTLKLNNKYEDCSYYSILSFLECSDEEFYNFFKNEENYNGINKSKFLYMVNEFYKYYNEGYLFDSNIIKRINYINKQTDIEFVVYDKKFISNNDDKYKNININSDFKNKILNNIPDGLTKLEIAIYIYIKLCKELNYDLEYYLVKQKGPKAEIHKNIDKVKDVNLTNNNVVCYEFNALYAYFLNKFNIDFEIRQHGDNYGDGHAWLRVNVDNLLISFDSMHRIFWEFDLLQAKINNPLRGIKLYNKNKLVNDDFNETLNKIYKMVIKEYNIDEDIRVDKYTDFVKDNNISSFNKLELMVEKTEKLRLSDMESIAYLLNMHKQSLSEDSEEKIEKELLIKKINDELKLSILFISYNKYMKDNDKQYTYSIYTPGDPFRRYDDETLKTYLDNGIYDVYEKDRDITIPGIDYISKKEVDINIGRIR